jgi:hypothetical protein
MRWLWAAGVIGVLGCDSGGQLLGFTLTDASSDTPVEGATDLGPFRTPNRLDTISVPYADDEDPTLTEDELEIFFCSDRWGTRDIWKSTRPTVDAAWTAPVRVDELSSFASDEDPGIAADGLSIWFVSDRAGGLETLWTSHRSSRDATWEPPVLVSELGSFSSNLRAPCVDRRELTLAFVVEHGPIGGADILIATRPTTASPWQDPAPLREIDTPMNDWDPWLGEMDLQIVWATNDRQIVVASRPDVARPFGQAAMIEGIGVPAYDPTLSYDLRHIVFASDRDHPGSSDIYEAYR